MSLPHSTSQAASLMLRQGIPLTLSQSKTVPNPHLPVARWLLGCTGLVAGIVHVGGVTRLTKSGLSMTDWKPLGSRPPMTLEEWETEFARYKTFPEFEQRQSMTLDEFKYIYFWEWGHRMLGRTVGVCFALPWAWHTYKGNIPRVFQPRLAALFALGGTQGLVGWWMVRSGLGEDRRGDRKEIRVSPYRLAAHLTVAATTFGLLGKTTLDMLSHVHRDKLHQLATLLQQSDTYRPLLGYARRTRQGAVALTGLTGLTLASGAFVAGNDAGLAYNTFPKMTDDAWVPWDDLVAPHLEPKYRNAFENTALVQLNHRVLGVGTAVTALALAGASLLHPTARRTLTPQAVTGLRLVGGVATAQASLGVATLLSYVPLEMAALHQVGSLALLGSSTYLVHSLRYVRPKVLSSSTSTAAQQLLGNGGVARVIPGTTMKPAL